MTARAGLSFAAWALLGWVTLIPVALSAPNSTQPGLRYYAKKKDFLIGGALSLSPETQADPQYLSRFAQEFNLVVPENVMKFEFIHPRTGQGQNDYDFTLSDRLMKFADENEMKVRGHTLVWHSQIPPWLRDGKFSPVELERILHEHVFTVAGKYRGRIYAWDVVNEAVLDNPKESLFGFGDKLDPKLRTTLWSSIGKSKSDYLRLAFRWTKEADPAAKLFYNDYGGEGLGKKSNAVYEILKTLKAEGVPIDGVGLQMHLNVYRGFSESEFRANLDRLSRLSLIIHITEMDVAINKGDEKKPEILKRQAEIYGNALKICQEFPACKALLTWGLTDKFSWIPEFTKNRKPPQLAPLLLDEFYHEKPAYSEIKGVLER